MSVVQESTRFASHDAIVDAVAAGELSPAQAKLEHSLLARAFAQVARSTPKLSPAMGIHRSEGRTRNLVFTFHDLEDPQAVRSVTLNDTQIEMIYANADWVGDAVEAGVNVDPLTLASAPQDSQTRERIRFLPRSEWLAKRAAERNGYRVGPPRRY